MRTHWLLTILYAIYSLLPLRLPEPFPPPAQVRLPPDLWNPGLSVFQWHSGSVQFPPNFRFEALPSADTLDGKFTSPDGQLVVHLSAGNMAGTMATPHPGTVFFRSGFIQRSRLWISTSRFSPASPFVHHLSFPDADCTNFSIYSRDEASREFLLRLAHTFRPTGPLVPHHTCS